MYQSGITEVRLLGGLSILTEAGGEAGAVLAQPKRFALLAYLAVAIPRGLHRRDTLLPLFWPEADQEHARTSLRGALYFLRRELGPDLIQSRGSEEIGLAPGRCRCDAVALEDAVKAGRFEEAMELYRGDLLAGFHLSEAPDFEHWMEETRARLRDEALRAAWSLAEHETGRGRFTDGVRWARRAMELSPYDEAGLRLLIALLTRRGDRPGAVLAYERFAERLSTDLGLAPSADTLALIETVRSAPAAAQPDRPADAALPPAGVVPRRRRRLAAGLRVSTASFR